MVNSEVLIYRPLCFRLSEFCKFITCKLRIEEMTANFGRLFEIYKSLRIISNSIFKRGFAHTASVKKELTYTSTNGQDFKLNSVWLRENCQCDSCYTHSTNQRKILFNTFDSKIAADRQYIQNNNLNVIWNDGHKSFYGLKWLESCLVNGMNLPSHNIFTRF